MATRIETLGGGKRAPKGCLDHAVRGRHGRRSARDRGAGLADGTTTEPSRRADVGAVAALEPATRFPRLVKAGLQPRPFSEIPVAEGTVEEVPDGFLRMPGGELRPRFGS